MEIAAVILAAGRSARFAGRNKLLLPIKGKPIIAAVVDTAAGAGFSPIVVVTGHDEAGLCEALREYEIAIVTNRGWREGLASSLRTGIAALSGTVDGALIMLGDMPLVQESTLQALRMAFITASGERIVYPTYRDQQGNPVLLPARFFDHILKLQGDRGAKGLLKKYASETVAVPVESDDILLDIDREEDYGRILSLPEIPHPHPPAGGFPPLPAFSGADS